MFDAAPASMKLKKALGGTGGEKGFGFTGAGQQIIAIGPMGGKIIGYGAFHKPIYADSTEALKLHAHKAKHTPSVQSQQTIDGDVDAWLTDLDFKHSKAPGVVAVDEEQGKLITESFGVSPAKQLGPGKVGFHTIDLWQHLGDVLKPAKDKLIDFQAKVAAGAWGEEAPFSQEYLAKLKMGGSAGGSHNHTLQLLDEKGNLAAIWKTKDLVICRAEEAASRIAQLVFPEKKLLACAEVLTLKATGQAGVILSLVPMKPGPPDKVVLGPETGHKIPATAIKKHAYRLIQHQVLDWLVANHDAHGGNFVETPDGDLAAFDKGQAWKWVGEDKLDVSYNPNSKTFGDAYQQLWSAFDDGDLHLDEQKVIDAVNEVLSGIATNLSIEQLKSLMSPYLAQVGEGKWAAIEKRYLAMKDDFETFLSKQFGHAVKLSTTPKGVAKDAPVPLIVTNAVPVAMPATTPPAAPQQTVEDVKPKLVMKMPGWPMKKGKVTVHKPGNPPPSSWPQAYPGPGFHAEVEYKGTKYEFVFGQTLSGKPSVDVFLASDSTLLASGKTIQEAADIPTLHQLGLPLTMNATEKKNHKPQISYPAKKLLNLDAFAEDFKAVGASMTVGTSSVTQLEEQKVVTPAQKTLNASEILHLAYKTSGVVDDLSSLPIVVQDFAKKHTVATVGADWKAPPPGSVWVSPTLTGSGTAMAYAVGTSVHGEPVVASFAISLEGMIHQGSDMPWKQYGQEWKEKFLAATKDKLDAMKVAAPQAPAEKVGAAPAAIPEPTKSVTVSVPANAPMFTPGPLPKQTVISVHKKNLGEVVLTVKDDDTFNVHFKGLGGDEKGVDFKSLSAACDHVWVVAQPGGYKDAADYKKQKNTNKVPSGGGWKFWGLAAKPELQAPVAAVVTSGPSGISAAKQVLNTEEDFKEAPIGTSVTWAGIPYNKVNADTWQHGKVATLFTAAEMANDPTENHVVTKWGGAPVMVPPDAAPLPETTPPAPVKHPMADLLESQGFAVTTKPVKGAIDSAPTGSKLTTSIAGETSYLTKQADGTWQDSDTGDVQTSQGLVSWDPDAVDLVAQNGTLYTAPPTLPVTPAMQPKPASGTLQDFWSKDGAKIADVVDLENAPAGAQLTTKYGVSWTKLESGGWQNNESAATVWAPNDFKYNGDFEGEGLKVGGAPAATKVAWKLGDVVGSEAELHAMPVGTAVQTSSNKYVKQTNGLWKAPSGNVFEAQDFKGAFQKPPSYPLTVIAPPIQQPIAAPVPPKPVKVVADLESLPKGAASITKAIWNAAQKFQETKAGPEGKHTQAMKSPMWPEWVPPPGVVVEGEIDGKKFFTTTVSGYTSETTLPNGAKSPGAAASLVEFVVWNEDGTQAAGGTKSASADHALTSAFQSAVGKSVAMGTLIEGFHLEGAKFPPDSTFLEHVAPAFQTMVTVNPADVPAEQKQTKVTKTVALQDLIGLKEPQDKYQGKFTTSFPKQGKFPGCVYLELGKGEKGSSAEHQHVTNLAKFIADHGLKDAVKSGSPKASSFGGGAWIAVLQSALAKEVATEMTVAEAIDTAPETPLVAQAAVSWLPASGKVNDPTVLAAAPVGTVLKVSNEHKTTKWVKTSLGWHYAEGVQVSKTPTPGTDVALAAWPKGVFSGPDGKVLASWSEAATATAVAAPVVSKPATTMPKPGAYTKEVLDSLPVGSKLKWVNGDHFIPNISVKTQDGTWKVGVTNAASANMVVPNVHKYALVVDKKADLDALPLGTVISDLDYVDAATGQVANPNTNKGWEKYSYEKVDTGWLQLSDTMGTPKSADAIEYGGGQDFYVVTKLGVTPAPVTSGKTAPAALYNSADFVDAPIGTQVMPLGAQNVYTKQAGQKWVDQKGDDWKSEDMAEWEQHAGGKKEQEWNPHKVLKWGDGTVATAPTSTLPAKGEKVTSVTQMEGAPIGAQVTHAGSSIYTKSGPDTWKNNLGHPLPVSNFAGSIKDGFLTVVDPGSATASPVASPAGPAWTPVTKLFKTWGASKIDDAMVHAPDGTTVTTTDGKTFVKQGTGVTVWLKEGHTYSSFSMAQQVVFAGGAVVSAKGAPVPAVPAPKPAPAPPKKTAEEIAAEAAKKTELDAKVAKAKAFVEWQKTHPAPTGDVLKALAHFQKAVGGKKLYAYMDPTGDLLIGDEAGPQQIMPPGIGGMAVDTPLGKMTLVSTKAFVDSQPVKWLDEHDPVKPTTQLGKALAWFQKENGGKPLIALKEGTGFLVKAVDGTPLEWKGHPLQTIHTPLGEMTQFKAPSFLASYLQAGEVKGPDGKDYPHGTTFTEKQVPLGTKQAEVAKLPGFYKLKGASTSDPTQTMTKWKVPGVADAHGSDAAIQHVTEQLKTLGITPTNVFAGSDGTMAQVPTDDLKKPAGFKTEVVADVPPQPKPFENTPVAEPKFTPAVPPFSLGPQPMGSKAIPNEGDFAALPVIKPGPWGHFIATGGPGVWKNLQVCVRKVTDSSGKKFTEICGDLLFDATNTKLKKGTFQTNYFDMSDKANPAIPYDYDTAEHKQGDEVNTDGGYSYDSDGTSIAVSFGKNTAYVGTTVVKIPEGKDVQAELQKMLAMALPGKDVTAPYGDDAERIFKKSQLVRLGLGPKGWGWRKGSSQWSPSSSDDFVFKDADDDEVSMAKYADEKFLDEQLTKLGMTDLVSQCEIRIGDGGKRTVYVNPKTSGEDFAEKIKLVQSGLRHAIGKETALKIVLDTWTRVGAPSRKQAMFYGSDLPNSQASSDAMTGGASGVMTRTGTFSGSVAGGGDAYYRAIFHPRVLNRTDWRWHGGDHFGSVLNPSAQAQDHRRQHLVKTVDMNKSGNETLFENGIGIEDFAGIWCEDEARRKDAVDGMKASGRTHVNGIPVEDFFFTCAESVPTVAGKAPGLKKGVLA